jgi:hypothetical protein
MHIQNMPLPSLDPVSMIEEDFLYAMLSVVIWVMILFLILNVFNNN